MNMKMCATSDVAKAWNSIDWNKANAYVKKLQMRIVKAHQQGRTGKVKSLQWLLTHSFYGRALAVKRVMPSFGFTVTSCLPYWVFSVVNSPRTISGCSAKYEFTK